jgi:hypothetical protein
MSAQEFNGDLVASTVTTVTFDDYVQGISIENLSPEGSGSVIYGTANGVDPSVVGSNDFAVEPGDIATVNNGAIWYQSLLNIDNELIAPPSTEVRLISSGTPSYSVSA